MIQVFTDIWVPADLLDNALVEVSRVSKETSGNVVSVLESTEGSERQLGPFEEIPLRGLDLEVLILNPVVMC